MCNKLGSQYTVAVATATRIRSNTLSGWCDPELMYRIFASGSKVSAWLDSSDGTGRSIIAVAAEHTDIMLSGGDGAIHSPEKVLSSLRKKLEVAFVDERIDQGKHCAVGWFGWFAYEFGVSALDLRTAAADTPDAAFFFADRVLVFDHDLRSVSIEWVEEGENLNHDLPGWIAQVSALFTRLCGADGEELARATQPASATRFSQTSPANSSQMLVTSGLPIRWRHATAKYRDLILECQRAITRGDAYQLCLTNQIEVAVSADPLTTFARLRGLNPTHHGGLLRFGDYSLVSSSPEQFLAVDRDGGILSKPMKGTRRRSADPIADAAARAELLSNEKELAENLMIVDLMRNDLGRVAELGTVQVPNLHDIETYAQVHQLVSTVTARLKQPLNAIDAIGATFPAGSMTGAPKEKAIELLFALESGPRGVYSGAYGILALDGAADFAMTIRSIVLTKSKATIGTGGGITALSDPDDEVEEIKTKASAMLSALGLSLPDD